MTLPALLKIGDVVVLKRLPESVSKSQARLRDGPDGFLRVYQRAIDKKSRLHVDYIDEYSRPWVQYSFKNKSNKYEHHHMLVDDDSYEIINSI